MDQAPIASALSEALEAASNTRSFAPLVDGIRSALSTLGVQVDRLQLPLWRRLGFRHPTLGMVFAEWDDERGHDATTTWTHAEMEARLAKRRAALPFADIVFKGEPYRLVCDLQAGDEPELDVARGLRARGYRGYLVLGLPVPSGLQQMLAVCSRDPFPPDTGERLDSIRPLLGIVVYAAIRTSQALSVSQVYIGRESGPRVLEGEIQRGSTERLEAGILFCDIRGFTALSERVGPEEVVRIVNEVFAVVGAAAECRGGEILKFIGDAMLLVFPVDQNRNEVARAMVDTARESIAGVAALDSGVQVGFGGHIGEVVQGNIGTPVRLDFTVMGPAVNLANRLEGLCKPLQVAAVFSDAVAVADLGLHAAGPQTVKGVATPVQVFTL